MANTLDQLNERFRRSSAKPRISGMTLHFHEDSRVQATITVSIGRSGYGFGNIVLEADDKRLTPVYELMREVIDDAAKR